MGEAKDTAAVTLSADEMRRYSRHLLLPEVGLDGQRALKAARVLCVGAGGLGSAVSMYLAAAGVGTLAWWISTSLTTATSNASCCT